MSEQNSQPVTPAEPASEPASLRYWKGTDGFSYQEMIRTRGGQGNGVYSQQESFLTRFIQGEQRRLGRPLEVLEFGCGFGRHASYLSQLEGVRYHGYDMSEAMVAPLRQFPPAALRPVEERLFIGDEPLVSLGARRFDLVFTVSVLIHNPTERIPGLLETLGRLTRPEGLVCLVENPIVPFGLWENDWHQGCWLHAYAEAMPPGWDLHHGPGLTDTHDVYVLKRNGGQERRYFELKGPEQARDESQPLHLAQLQARGMGKLHAWTASATRTLQQGPTDAGRGELQEHLGVESERLQRRQRLFALADELVGVRNRKSTLTPAALHAPAPQTSSRPTAPPPGVLFDEPLDTQWAHMDPGFSRVIHVFHQQWHGIRAAAGYSPGRKLAISAERPLTQRELHQAVEYCAQASSPVVIVHSFSANAHEFIVALRKVLGHSVRILNVWHGSTAQFHYDYEYETFAGLMDLRARGTIDGVACVKPDMHLVSGHIFPKTLFNLAPRIAPSLRRTMTTPSRSALIAMPNDWRKNFYTNLYACMGAEHIRQVYVTARFLQSKHMTLSKPVRHLESPKRDMLFGLMRNMDVVLNASLSECQPMTALEGLSLRVPCITGPLGLGLLDEHPFQRLVQIDQVDVVGAVRDVLERVLTLQENSPQQLLGMMDSYEALLRSEAIHRYQEFIHS